MAYVGTPSFSNSSTYTLASILQGEAGNQGFAGMQAVASVIQNRAAQNFSGYGSSLLDQALAPNQFQGQASPSPEALSVASQLQSGTLPDNTFGATYYANPTLSTASWATNLSSSNSLQIGDQYFTDNTQGVPFQPDTSSSATDGGSSLSFASGANADSLGSGGASLDSSEPFSGSGMDANGGPFDLSGGDASAVGGGAEISASNPGSIPGVTNATMSDSGIQSALGSNISSGTVSSGLSFVGGGPPIEVTNISSAGQQAGEDVQQGVQNASAQLSKAVTTSTQTATVAGTNLVGSLESAATDLTIRGGLILVAVALLFGAWAFFSSEKSNGPIIVPI